MKNPVNNMEQYKVTTELVTENTHGSYKVTVAYSPSNIVHAFINYYEKSIARAGGGGYDKMTTALVKAIELNHDIDLKYNGAAGITDELHEKLAEHSITLERI